jgi:hypothetical protein
LQICIDVLHSIDAVICGILKYRIHAGESAQTRLLGNMDVEGLENLSMDLKIQRQVYSGGAI